MPFLKVAAIGLDTSGGWSNPELGTWSYIAPPADGILDMDFMATPPAKDAIVHWGLEKKTAKALFPVPGWVKGVRIHAASKSMTKRLPRPLPAAKEVAVEKGIPRHSPFPWYIPQSPPA
jgi:hypothetical protein